MGASSTSSESRSDWAKKRKPGGRKLSSDGRTVWLFTGEPTPGGQPVTIFVTSEEPQGLIIGRADLIEWGDRSPGIKNCSKQQVRLVAEQDSVSLTCLGRNPAKVRRSSGALLQSNGSGPRDGVHGERLDDVGQGQTVHLKDGDAFYLYPVEGRGVCLFRVYKQTASVQSERSEPGVELSPNRRTEPTKRRKKELSEGKGQTFAGMRLAVVSSLTRARAEILKERIAREGGSVIFLDGGAKERANEPDGVQQLEETLRPLTHIVIDDLHILRLAIKGNEEDCKGNDAGLSRAIIRRRNASNGVHVVALPWLFACLRAKKVLDDTYELPDLTAPPEEIDGKDGDTTGSISGGEGASHKPDAQHFPFYCCQRETPLNHPNKHITQQLDEIANIYYAKGDKNRELAYSRGSSVLKAWHKKVETLEDVIELQQVPGLGSRILESIKEAVTGSGAIKRLEELKSVKKNSALVDLCNVYGIGPGKASELVDRGIESAADLEHLLRKDRKSLLQLLDDGKAKATTIEAYTSPNPIINSLTLQQKLGVLYSRDLAKGIDRPTADEVIALVTREIRKAVRLMGLDEKQTKLEICGGYCRGKTEMHDIDILMTHPDKRIKDSLQPIAQRLTEVGVLLHSLQQMHMHDQFGTQVGQHPTRHLLEESQALLGVMLWKGVYRRIDIVLVENEQWIFQILGWAGSKQFERDLRRYAADLGFKLTHQGLFTADATLIDHKLFPTEEDIFKFLKLKYIPRHLRHA